MATLRELHEKNSKRAPAQQPDDGRRKRILTLLRESGAVRRSEEVLGEALWALSVVSSPDQSDDEGDEDKKPPVWTLVFLTTNIEITDRDVAAFAAGPSVFDPNAPAECLLGDLTIEEGRLLQQSAITEDDLRGVFGKIERALDRKDLPERVRDYLHNAVLQFGVNAEAFAAAKLKELRDKQQAANPRDLREETRKILRARQIAYRMLAVQNVVGSISVKHANEVGRLGGLANRMEHLDAVRERIFYRKDGRGYVEELLKGRLFDRGLLTRLAIANDHLDRLLKKFEEYVAGYAVTGSWIARADDARSDSDLDVIVLINDVDVRKMGRRELTGKLSAQIRDLAGEAANAKGMPTSILHPTVMLLTKALQAQHDGEVVLWSMLELAFVLHDPHSYLRTWQLLLREGAVAPSERYADELLDSARTDVFFTYRRIRECIMDDLYAGVLKAAQSVLVRLGDRVLPPARVITRLREREEVAADGVDPHDLKKVADCMESLRDLYQQYKRMPFMHVPPERLAELMRDAEAAFDLLEELCKALGNRVFHEGRRELQVVGKLR